jgi:hypothetical protein
MLEKVKPLEKQPPWLKARYLHSVRSRGCGNPLPRTESPRLHKSRIVTQILKLAATRQP